uniref:Uncharacterized protein n=1 Tax=Caenorhabditis japonica TaxID=281687 RepID=A0A8R1ER96_CAEJA
MPRRPPLLRLAPVPEDVEDDDEVFEKNDDKKRILSSKRQRFQTAARFQIESDDLPASVANNNSEEEEESKVNKLELFIYILTLSFPAPLTFQLSTK